MTYSELNKLLVSELPFLQVLYDDEISWQDGNDTGSHVVFGGVFTPYLLKCIISYDESKLKTLFNFIEFVLEKNDEYADEVIALSVFESIQEEIKERKDVLQFLGIRSKTLFDDVIIGFEVSAKYTIPWRKNESI